MTDYSIRLFFGRPGCGKTTFASKIIGGSRLKRFANVDLSDCEHISLDGMGKDWVLPLASHLIVDEASIAYNNRRFKSMDPKLIEYFKLHRHYRLKIDFFSQAWDDIDITIRRLVDEIWYLRKIGPFTIARKVRKEVCIDQVTQQIIDGYKFVKLWHMLFGEKCLLICYRPKYYSRFDSFETPVGIPVKLREGELHEQD